MRGRHHNTFYYYRGPSPKGGDEREEAERQDRQVEDNTTKALINLLEHADARVTESFIGAFLPQALAATGASANPADREYFLQGGPSAPVTEDRWLLGLAVLGELDPGSRDGAQTTQGSRVDAAIHLPGRALVLVEVKVVEYLDYQQLKRHAAEWRIPVLSFDSREWPREGRWALGRWADVYRWASAERERTAEPVSQFLLDQFLEYLEILGLAPFGGFREEHFAYFRQPVDQRTWERHAEVKARLGGLWEAVLEQLSERDATRLGEIHVARFGLSDEIAAAQTNWGEAGANLTVELTAEELQLNIVGWTADRAEQLSQWLAPTGTVREAPTLVDHELVVFRRRPSNYAQKDAGKRPFFQRETFAIADRVPLADLAGAQLMDLEGGWREDPDPNWEKLAFHIRRSWPRDEVARRGAELVLDVAAAVQHLIPVLDEINPVAHPAPRAEPTEPPGEQRKLTNDELTLDVIPMPGTDDHETNSITRFARTFNGYRYHSLAGEIENCAAVSNATRTTWERTGRLPETVTELRSALFFQARSDHFSGGYGLESDYDTALVRAIREKVAAGDVEHAPAIERVPMEYSFESRFGRLQLIRSFEGGAVYAAERDGAFFLVVDEGTMADFLDDGDSDLASGLRKLLRFESEQARTAYLTERGWATDQL